MVVERGRISDRSSSERGGEDRVRFQRREQVQDRWGHRRWRITISEVMHAGPWVLVEAQQGLNIHAVQVNTT